MTGTPKGDYMNLPGTRFDRAIHWCSRFSLREDNRSFATNRAVVITVLSIIGFPAVQGIGIGLRGMGLAARR
jgi:hypothetical protein